MQQETICSVMESSLFWGALYNICECLSHCNPNRTHVTGWVLPRGQCALSGFENVGRKKPLLSADEEGYCEGCMIALVITKNGLFSHIQI